MNSTSTNVIPVTDATFGPEIEQARGLALVDFWATWCAPCRLIAPVVEQLAADYAGRVRVASVDTEQNQRTMVRLGVRSLPTLLFVRDGVVVDRIVGAVPRSRIEEKLREHLSAVTA